MGGAMVEQVKAGDVVMLFGFPCKIHEIRERTTRDNTVETMALVVPTGKYKRKPKAVDWIRLSTVLKKGRPCQL